MGRRPSAKSAWPSPKFFFVCMGAGRNAGPVLCKQERPDLPTRCMDVDHGASYGACQSSHTDGGQSLTGRLHQSFIRIGGQFHRTAPIGGFFYPEGSRAGSMNHMALAGVQVNEQLSSHHKCLGQRERNRLGQRHGLVMLILTGNVKPEGAGKIRPFFRQG